MIVELRTDKSRKKELLVTASTVSGTNLVLNNDFSDTALAKQCWDSLSELVHWDHDKIEG